MNIKPQDILARLQTLVDEQTGIESALAQMDEQRSTLTTRHAELTALLTAVCGALGVSVAKAPEEPAVELPLPALPDGIAAALDDFDDAQFERGHDRGRGANATEKERNESKAAAEAARTVLENRIRRALATK